MKQCNHPCCSDVCRRPKKKPVRKPISRFSKKRVKENRKYSAQRKKFLTHNPVCQFPDCQKVATDVHHGKGRGKYLLDTKTWKVLCRDHHRIVEEKPVLGKQLGLSESRLTT